MQLSRKEERRQEKLGGIWDNELKLVFDDIAEKYEHANAFISFGLWKRMRQKFIKWMNLSNGAQILDVCAGTNSVGIDLLLKNPSLNVTAVDRSQGMQRIGTQRASELNLSIKSVISDVHALPFSDNSFDIVTLEAATRHLEVNKAFEEILRVLKPGGHFYHCDLVKPKNQVVGFLYYNYLRIMIPVTSIIFFRTTGFLGMKESVIQLRDYFIEAIHIFYTSDELSEILEELGFKEIEAKHMLGGTVAIHKSKK